MTHMNLMKVTLPKIAVLGITANMLLSVLKLIFGYISSSQAMIADGFNSIGDVFSSAMTYAGNKIASEPQDPAHPFGHGKAEYIFSMIISFSLMLVAYKVFTSSLNAIMQGKTFIFSWWLVAVAVLTIIIKLILFIYTTKEGHKHDNLLILANSEDHRNDIFVTSSTLLGIVLGKFNIYLIDSVIGIAISIWIAYTGVKVFLSAYHVLMDTTIDKSLKENIIKVIELINGVDHIDSITAKPIGINYLLIVKVSVQSKMTVEISHSIAAQIKKELININCIEDVVVHINPV